MQSVLQCMQPIIDSIPDAAITVDQYGIIVSVNKPLLSLFECSEDIVGKPIDSLVPLEFQEQHAAYVQGYMENTYTRDFGKQLNIIASTPQGIKISVDIMLMPISTKNSTFALAIIRDLDSFNKITTKLKSLIHKLESSSIFKE